MEPATMDQAASVQRERSNEDMPTKPAECSWKRPTAEDILLGTELSCLAYLDDTQETIDHEVPMITRVFGAVAAGRTLTDLLMERGYVIDRIFGDGEAPGFIAHRPGEVVLACRGSTGLADMPANFDVFLVPFRPLEDGVRACTCNAWFFCTCEKSDQLESQPDLTSSCDSDDFGDRRVHRGYYNMLLSLLPSLERILLPQLLDPEPKRLIFAGHSRGGSLALLALAYLMEKVNLARCEHPLFVFSAGAPRLGNTVFDSWFRSRMATVMSNECLCVRVVHGSDGIPDFPSESFGFAHSGMFCCLTQSGKLLFEEDEEELCIAEQDSSFMGIIDDHQPYNYHAAVLKVIHAHGIAADFM
eukprot:TRINITY_DN19035_c0_g1_i2.p1 TRINITY_DN19035_c0_g1~~TRINITY_DN19035_c0_g1_i2.p1  ORF type:complete len:358 (+),score=55.10 TRINITY_DN19035_c0_g1_i2:182-1255(+)